MFFVSLPGRGSGLGCCSARWFASAARCAQPIVVTFPQDATWTFTHADALGEKLGHGKAKVTFDPGRGLFSMALTEQAFGDRATLSGKLPREADDHGNRRFDARGAWFDGRRFRFVGCFDGALTAVRPGAVAVVESDHQRLRSLPALADPCGTTPIKPATEAEVDRLFFWSATARRR